tara:strand:- start:374 stop:577 length:204 start_codon:yes stop_codon:yes gene_type:complete
MNHSELTHLIAMLQPQAPTHVVDHVVEKLSQLCFSVEEKFVQAGESARQNQNREPAKPWNPNDPANW